jgi:MFS transporter, MHS family, shikimate and dehydroshikimate transport protein
LSGASGGQWWPVALYCAVLSLLAGLGMYLLPETRGTVAAPATAASPTG